MALTDTRLARKMQQKLRSYVITGLGLNSLSGWEGLSRRVSSGVAVNEATALRYSAFFSGINLISSQLATPPLFLLKRDQDNGKSRFPVGNPLYRLIHDRPNPEMSSFEWRKVMQAHALTWAGGFSEIERDGSNRPVALWPLVPGRVRPFRRSAGSDLQYLVSNPNGGDVIIDRMDMVHIKGLSLDGVNGLNMVDQMSESLGLGIAAERFGAEFYGNGASFGGVISYPGDATDLAKKNNRDTLAARHQGVENAHKLLALYGGAQYQQIGISPNLAQFLETRQFQVTEVARWLNIPPHKLGDLTRSTNNNIEQQDIDFYKTTMLPWFTSWEQELWYKLVPRLEQNQQIIEFFVDGLLRGDVAARGEFYAKQSQAGAITPNEIRGAENRNNVPGGDISLVPLNTIPLHLIASYYEAEIESKKASTKVALAPKPEPPPPPTEPMAPKRELDQAIEARDRARVLAQQAEEAKDVARAELEAVTASHLRQIDALREAEAERVRLVAQATALGVDLARAVSDVEAAAAAAREADAHTATIEARLVTVEATLVTRDRTAEEAAQRQIALTGELQTRTSERDEIGARVARVEADYERVCEEKRTLAAAADASEAVVRELRAQIERVSAAQTALVLAESRAGALTTEKDAALVKATEAETRAAALASRLSASTDAARASVAYTLQCIVRREADRARKAQATPEKLAKWIDHFYLLHDEYCREALRPVVRAWLAVSGSSVPLDVALDQIVAAHLDVSMTQLRAVTADSTPETLAPALEKLLRRWEAERAALVADRFCQEAA